MQGRQPGDVLAGLNARTVADVTLFNRIFSDCDTSGYKAVKPSGLRVGYPTDPWKEIAAEVCNSLFVLCRDCSCLAFPILNFYCIDMQVCHMF